MMLSGSLPVITAILSKIFFSRIITKNQYLGIGVIVVGSFVLGYVAYNSSETGETSNTVLGIILSFSSLFAFGFLMIAEEYLLRNYYV